MLIGIPDRGQSYNFGCGKTGSITPRKSNGIYSYYLILFRESWYGMDFPQKPKARMV